MLVSEFARRIRNQMGDTTGALFTDQMIVDWINDAQRDIVLRNKLLHTKATTSTIVGQSEVSVPAELLSLYAVLYNGQPIDVENNPEIKEDRSSSRGTPQSYSVYGDIITLFPAPSAVGTIELWFSRIPNPVVAQTDTPETPSQYDGRILEYCLAQAAAFDDDTSKYQQKIAEFEQNLSNMLDNASGDTDETYPFISVHSPEYPYYI